MNFFVKPQIEFHKPSVVTRQVRSGELKPIKKRKKRTFLHALKGWLNG